jgi:MFS family permease
MNTRRTTLLAGIISLLGATILLCFARTFVLYVVARLFQGISSAIVWIVGPYRLGHSDFRPRIDR